MGQLPPLTLPSADIGELRYEDWVGPLNADVWRHIIAALGVGTLSADEFIAEIRASRTEDTTLAKVMGERELDVAELREDYMRVLEWVAEMEGAVRALPPVMGAFLTLLHQVQGASAETTATLSALMQSLGSKGGEANAEVWRRIERFAISLASDRWEGAGWRSAAQAANDIRTEVSAYAAANGKAFVSGGQDKIAEWLRAAGFKRGYGKVGTSG